MVHADYIILGAGVAGCTLASEIYRRQLGSVLVIEAGSLPTSRNLKIPSQYPKAFGSKFDWDYKTVPQKHLAGRRISLPAGRSLGGSSSLNAMIFLPGHRNDYVRWAQILGNDWNASQTEAAFREIEDRIELFKPSETDLSQGVWRTLDLLSSAMPRFDFLRRPNCGIGPFIRCQSQGRRIPAWRLGFPNAEVNQLSDGTISLASNIKVLLNATAQEIWIDQDRAMGVRLADGNILQSAKGVVVACGALASPLMLMRSGIGDRTELQEAGINLRVSSPKVGKNLSDHLVFPLVWSSAMGSPFDTSSRNARHQYVQQRQGPLASNLAEAGGFFRIGKESDSPQFQWHITPTHYLEYPHRSSEMPMLSIGVTPLHPQSRGSVRISRHADSLGQQEFTAVIDPNYLSEPDDLEQFLVGLRWTRQLVNACNFHDCFLDERLPGTKRQDNGSLERAIARLATTLYHYTGTCAMGPNGSDVLDTRFRVRGIEKLWVCDASAMPTSVSANTQATVMMMCHKLMDWLTLH